MSVKNCERAFSEFWPAVETVLESHPIGKSTDIQQFVQDELAKVSHSELLTEPQNHSLQKLYELRAKYLDWELGTGYLGNFSEHAGTRYAFTRIKNILWHACPQPMTDLRILEIGCGAGLFSLLLAQKAALVIGIDVSSFVLKFANRVKNELQCHNLFFECGDAETLMFQAQTFDVVICSEVLEHLTAPENALAEMRRILKPSGTLILSTPCAFSVSDIAMRCIRWFYPQIETEKVLHFDKKTYLAIIRHQHDTSAKDRGNAEMLDKTAFIRIHKRFQYTELRKMFQCSGFHLKNSWGAVLTLPPHHQIFYRYCPKFILPMIEMLEQGLNTLKIFQRFGSVTTCFRLVAHGNPREE